MGVDYMPFVMVYKDQVQSLQRHLGEYIKHLHRIKVSQLTGATLNEEGATELSIKTTSQGFPILPDVNLANLKKDDLEQLMRNYVGIHYSMSLFLTHARGL
jgi:hypothetical protein